MSLFITTLIFTLILFSGAALMINFCRKNAARTRHGLTSMCHQSGGAMCGSCASALQKKIEPKQETSARLKPHGN